MDELVKRAKKRLQTGYWDQCPFCGSTDTSTPLDCIIMDCHVCGAAWALCADGPEDCDQDTRICGKVDECMGFIDLPSPMFLLALEAEDADRDPVQRQMAEPVQG